MQFSPFGNEDDIKPQVTDHPGFSHGLIEGMLVRRGIDRQNQTDKLNESYNQKLMDMQEQEARDKVTMAALQAHKAQTDNALEDEFGRSKIQSALGLQGAQTRVNNIQADQAPKVLQNQTTTANAAASHAKTADDAEKFNEDPNNPRNVFLTARATSDSKNDTALSDEQVQGYIDNPDNLADALAQLTPKQKAQVIAAMPPDKMPKLTDKSPTKPIVDPLALAVKSKFLEIVNKPDSVLTPKDKQAELETLHQIYGDDYIEKSPGVGEYFNFTQPNIPKQNYKLKSEAQAPQNAPPPNSIQGARERARAETPTKKKWSSYIPDGQSIGN